MLYFLPPSCLEKGCEAKLKQPFCDQATKKGQDTKEVGKDDRADDWRELESLMTLLSSLSDAENLTEH